MQSILILEMATSLEFWRQVYPADRRPRNPVDLPSWVSAPASNSERIVASLGDDVWSLAPDWITPKFLAQTDGVLHTISFDIVDRCRSKTHVTHIWSGFLPHGSFYPLNSHVYIESPEFVFLSAANVLNLPQLIALGDELCGHYGFDSHEERGFRKRCTPLTTPEGLRKYLLNARGCPGIKKATLALSHIVSKSASPMETYDEALISLPVRMGGYGLKRPEMNRQVRLTKEAARIAMKNEVYLDISWPDINLDVEHHGKHDHSLPVDIDADRARVNALGEMGYEVIELTKKQVDDVVAFEYIVLRIAKRIGQRIRKDALGYKPERLALRKELSQWNRSYGKVR